MSMNFRSVLVIVLAGAAGCEVQNPTKDGGDFSPDSFSGDPAYRMTRAQIIADYSNAACDPLLEPEIPNDDSVFRGWFGEIRVPPAGYQSNIFEWEENLDRYMQPGAVLLESPLYVQNLDVPTRLFTEGFPTMSGGLVKDDAGNTLLEHFHFNLESGLTLGDLHEEGLYQFAMLSDDGVRLEIDDTTYLEETNKTPTKLVCGTTQVYLRRGEVRDLRVQYFQGPRNHIALQMLWRKVTSQTPRETLCGEAGNEEWFDYLAAMPTPNHKYRQLQSRGWSVVPASSFVLPGYEPLNPCLSERVKEVLAEEQQ